MELDNRAHYVLELFARISPRYNLVNDFITAGMHRWWRRRSATLALSLLQWDGAPPLKVIDLCCGTGDYLVLFWRRFGKMAWLVGVDFCHPMLEESQRRARRLGIEQQVRFLRGDVTNLSVLRAKNFHVATLGFGLRNVSDVRGTLSEARRILQPGGVLVILDLTWPKNVVVRSLILFYLRWILPLLAWLGKGGREDYLWLRRSLTDFPRADRLVQLMKEVGFEDVQVKSFGLGGVAVHVGRRPQG
jgi:demethylmenaquinone methyltransferase/2-methoxy-6-polyprenyl-1,4-benzoquinol methylase